MTEKRGDIANCAPVEEALHRNNAEFNLESKYRAILDRTFEFIGLMTPDGTLVEANRTALKFAGIAESDALGKPFWQTPWWTHSEEMQNRLRAAIKHAASGEFVRFEATHPAADGEIHTVDFSLKPITNDRGEVEFLIPEGRDITKQKWAEEGKREYESRFRDIVDKSGAGILFVDARDMTISSCNQAMAVMLGRSQEELAGLPLMELHPAESREQIAKEFEQHLVEDKHFSSDIPVMRKDGALIYVDITSNMVTLNGTRYLSGFFHDVTKRKRAEDALRETNKYLESLFNYANVPIIVWDTRFQITRFNHAFETLTGRKADEVLGKTLDILFPQSIMRSSLERIAETERGKHWEVVEMNILHIDGSERTVLWNSAPIYGPDEKTLTATIAQGYDITNRKRAEEILLQSKEQLEQYTTALETANMALEEAKTLAECANQAKTDFLANMSHELRTPLSAIIGFSEGLLERTDVHPLNEHQKDRLEKIKNSGEYLLQLINGVLDIAKAESGQIDLRIADFEVEPLAWEVGDLAEALAKDKPAIHFTLDLEERLPRMTSDRDKIRQILVNLLSNAVKFTEQGTVALRVRGRNDSIEFRVEDTGIGIGAEHLERIFEKFYQVKQIAHSSLKGTGLGLAISKVLATLLGGTLTVESVEGQGSIFTLTVPTTLVRRENDDSRQTARPSPGPRRATSQDRRQQPCILCVESNPNNAILLNDCLMEAGYRVIQTANGDEAFRLAASERPRAVILDVMLQSHDGWEILYRLKGDPTTSDIPVIIATDLDEQRLGLFLGASEYLVKPASRLQLLQAIHRVSLDHERNIQSVAVIDDDRSMLRLVANYLEQAHYRVSTFVSGEAFLASLATQQPDTVIVDLLMPHMDGFQFIETLREHPACSNVPVMVMTSKVLSKDDLAMLNNRVRAVIQKNGAVCEKAFRQLVEQLERMEAGRDKYVDNPSG